MKTYLHTLFTIISMIIFYSPFFAISVTGNWWFMFLFFASWIPAVPVLAIVWGFNKELKEEYQKELRKQKQDYRMN